jgi:hypothetical protein
MHGKEAVAKVLKENWELSLEKLLKIKNLLSHMQIA